MNYLLALFGLVLSLNLSLFADTVHLSDDASVNDFNPALNTRECESLLIQKYISNSESSTSVALMRFDLETVPIDKTVSHAFLRLYVNRVRKGGSIRIELLEKEWEEATVAFSDLSSRESIVVTSLEVSMDDEANFLVADVTAAVKAWESGEIENHGLILVPSEDSHMDVSMDSKETGHAPELEVLLAELDLTAGQGAIVAGGSENTSPGNHSTVGGGRANEASGATSTVSGGQENSARGTGTTVAGGHSNVATLPFSSVGGGISNDARGQLSRVGGGADNVARGSYATVGGGNDNMAEAEYTTIAGGGGNVASGISSFIGGGGGDRFEQEGNTALGLATTIGGGRKKSCAR